MADLGLEPMTDLDLATIRGRYRETPKTVEFDGEEELLQTALAVPALVAEVERLRNVAAAARVWRECRFSDEELPAADALAAALDALGGDGED